MSEMTHYGPDPLTLGALLQADAPICCDRPALRSGSLFVCQASAPTKDDEHAVCGKTYARVTFYVVESKLAALQTKIAKLGKRAAKLGCPAPVLSCGEAVDTFSRDEETGSRYIVRRFPVTITGEAPKLNGWRFAAALDHLGEANIIRSAGGEIPERYRNAADGCDHCHLDRNRKATYVLANDAAGTWTQVGSSCLKDFLGHPDPDSAAAAAELLASALGCADEDWDGEGGYGRGVHRYPLVDFLAVVAGVLRDSPWVSRKKARDFGGQATADEAWMHLDSPRLPKDVVRVVPTEADIAKATAALAWAEALGEGGASLSDYEHNVHTVAKYGTAESKTAGIAASIIGAREARQAAKKPPFAKGHVGEVGTRIELAVTLERIIPIESEQWGTSFLHLFRTDTGHACKWFASGGRLWIPDAVPSTTPGAPNGHDAEEGETIRIKGTIKGHSDFKGTDQTMLSRVIVAPPPKVKKPRAPRKTKAAAAQVELPEGEPKAGAA